jgi:hypothetical protein
MVHDCSPRGLFRIGRGAATTLWVIGSVLLLSALAGGAVLLWLRPAGSPDAGAADTEPWFEDVTCKVGVHFVHDAGDLSKYQQPQIHGSGVALFDFDGDGRLDIYLLTFGGPDSRSTNRLYKNMPDGTFQDVTEGSGLGIAGYSTGVAVGDVNNDGWPDVLVTGYGGIRLFVNNGNGTFTDVTEQAGLKNPLWAASANFFDYDRDGWLDLVVVNYLENDPSRVCHSRSGERDYCGPAVFHGTVSKLFHNLGPLPPNPSPPKRGRGEKDCPLTPNPSPPKRGRGENEGKPLAPRGGERGGGERGLVRFQDVTVASGLARLPGPGMGVCCADFNGDGWPDIFIANDGQPNCLWINQKNGTFTEEAFNRGIARDGMGQAQAGMGIAIGDVDGDGLFDIYVTHLDIEQNTLWQQGPQRGQFRDRTARSGLLTREWPGTGFGTLMGDFDQDGWLDLAVVNGAVLRGTSIRNPALGAHLQYYGERNQLFRNEGQGKFQDVSRWNNPFCAVANVARGLACGDLDGDGALDLVVTTVAGPARVFRNATRSRGHWLLVRALDPRLRRDAYGAEVRVQAGTRQWLRIVNPGESFQSSSDPRVHFGLGEAAHYDAVHVLWPDGRAEVFPGGAADQLRVLRRGEGREERLDAKQCGCPTPAPGGVVEEPGGKVRR